MESTPPPAAARSLADELFDVEPWQAPEDETLDPVSAAVVTPETLVGFEPEVAEKEGEEVEPVAPTYVAAVTPSVTDEAEMWPDTGAAPARPKANVTMFPEKKGLFGRRGAPKVKEPKEPKKPKKAKKSKKAEVNPDVAEATDF